jgi:hypothetical protein
MAQEHARPVGGLALLCVARSAPLQALALLTRGRANAGIISIATAVSSPKSSRTRPSANANANAIGLQPKLAERVNVRAREHQLRARHVQTVRRLSFTRVPQGLAAPTSREETRTSGRLRGCHGRLTRETKASSSVVSTRSR